jgi:hypothetical protein
VARAGEGDGWLGLGMEMGGVARAGEGDGWLGVGMEMGG